MEVKIGTGKSIERALVVVTWNRCDAFCITRNVACVKYVCT